MAIDTTSPRTRRAILLGALGATVASAAAAVGRASPIDAANGDVVHVGRSHTATSFTRITTTYADAIVGAADSGTGVVGTSSSSSGVFGRSDTSYGVYGSSTSKDGVVG